MAPRCSQSLGGRGQMLATVPRSLQRLFTQSLLPPGGADTLHPCRPDGTWGV